MSEMKQRDLLTEVERRAFSQKLSRWARTLAPREQDFLLAMLRAAAGGGQDTAGSLLSL